MAHIQITDRGTAERAADHAAAEAVVAHHAQLAATLDGYARALREAAQGEDAPRLWQHREALVTWLHGELLPHAYAEEAALYPVAAAQPTGRRLIDGMLAEHVAIGDLVNELENAASAVALASAARALSAVFAVHLAKENDLVVPLLVEAPDVSLAGLLDGLHDLIGAADDKGCDCGGCGCGAAGPGGSANE
ncbi:hemerythrin domain-containing protein [Luedemannella helvata]|uniref:Hemerythrin-like domain-containing protein n=1 Tax=Luedemannella helvata TaxID=349315 RepID=A0ABP4X014_9ACTN